MFKMFRTCRLSLNNELFLFLYVFAAVEREAIEIKGKTTPTMGQNKGMLTVFVALKLLVGSFFL